MPNPANGLSQKANSTNTLAPSGRKKTSGARHASRPASWPVILYACVGVLLVAGIGLYVVVGNSAPSSPTRPDVSNQTTDPTEVPAPMGTIHRMEGISKAFKK